MTSRFKTLFAIISLVSALGISPAFAHDKHCEDTELGALMADAKKLNKKLKKAARSEDYLSVVELTTQLIELTDKAREHKPLKYRGQEAAFAAKESDYQNYYDTMKSVLEELKAAAQAKSDSLKTLYKKLGQNTKKAHESFKKDCD